jgi:hypothetical protein
VSVPTCLRESSSPGEVSSVHGAGRPERWSAWKSQAIGRIAAGTRIDNGNGVAPDQRDALIQAGAGIAASRHLAGRSRSGAAISRWDPTRSLVGSLALLLFISAGCALRTPHIGHLQRDPARYRDKTVNISGVVTSSWGRPLVPFKLYKVEDDTGELTVISHQGRTPPRGARVRVTGRLSDVATLGGQSIGLHLEEDDLHVE